MCIRDSLFYFTLLVENLSFMMQSADRFLILTVALRCFYIGSHWAKRRICSSIAGHNQGKRKEKTVDQSGGKDIIMRLLTTGKMKKKSQATRQVDKRGQQGKRKRVNVQVISWRRLEVSGVFNLAWGGRSGRVGFIKRKNKLRLINITVFEVVEKRVTTSWNQSDYK